MKKICSLLLAVSMVFVLASCSKYYMVKDPSSEKTYYTKKIKEQNGGAIKFEDGKTGSEITLQNSEVTQIVEDDYKINTMMRETQAEEEKAKEAAPTTE